MCSEFRKEGKKLNRVVHAASKMGKVYNEVERQQLIKLNHCVSDLMTMLRPNIDKNSIMTVKRMIQAFVAEASGVLKMVEAKSGRAVQEGFFDKLKSKFKKEPKSLTELCRDLINMWDVDDSVWNAKELSDFVNEKDVTMFQTFIADQLTESALKCALIADKCIYDHPIACNQFKEMQAKFESFLTRLNDMLATGSDRELTVSEYETIQELKGFVSEMRGIVTRFLHEINPVDPTTLNID